MVTHRKEENKLSQVLPSDLFGCFKWPFQGLSDLHLGYQKVTWKKLEESDWLESEVSSVSTGTSKSNLGFLVKISAPGASSKASKGPFWFVEGFGAFRRT